MKKIPLSDLIGQHVSLENSNNYHLEDRFAFCLNGVLTHDEDYPDEFYVRVKEDGYGVSGMTFLERQINLIEKHPSGRISIILK